MTPLQKTEALYHELTRFYHEGDNAEIRAAAKLLLVALDKLHTYGGADWQGLITEYVIMIKQDPERFKQVLQANRGTKGN